MSHGSGMELMNAATFQNQPYCCRTLVVNLCYTAGEWDKGKGWGRYLGQNHFWPQNYVTLREDNRLATDNKTTQGYPVRLVHQKKKWTQLGFSHNYRNRSTQKWYRNCNSTEYAIGSAAHLNELHGLHLGNLMPLGLYHLPHIEHL